jgi:hypothetical protein
MLVNRCSERASSPNEDAQSQFQGWRPQPITKSRALMVYGLRPPNRRGLMLSEWDAAHQRLAMNRRSTLKLFPLFPLP